MSDEHDNELQKERGTNEQYMRLLRNDDDDGRGAVRAGTALPRNAQYLGTVAGGAKRAPHVEPFIGRVALGKDDPDLGTSFYIGSGFLDANGIIVIRWVAPMAQLFYKGTDADVDIADDLQARRTFSRRLDDIVDFEDAVEPDASGAPFTSAPLKSATVSPPPTAPRRPTVAAPPTPPTRPSPPPQSPTQAPPPAPAGREPDTEPAPTPPTSSEQRVAASAESTIAEPGNATLAQRIADLRAPNTVLQALTAPRTGRLSALLRTLQPQQYDLVTWPEDEHLVVQGHPGTGKTVIGLHRAAYLTDPDRLVEGQHVPRGDVLVLGPTDAYVEHVRPVMEELAVDGWAVWSLPHFYSQIGEFSDPHLPTEIDRISASREPLGRAIVRALEGYRGPRSAADFTDHLFACDDAVQSSAEHDREVIEFLRAGKNHEYARGHSRYHPTMALAGLAVTGVGLANRVRHVVVDEAQDLRPIDLLMLRLLSSNGVTLTLLGDMNQRRSDFTHADWDQVSMDAGIARADGTAPVVPISVGYRSTNQILRYAAGLLPRAERTAEALRDGLEPSTVRSTRPEAVFADARAEALRLQADTKGLVAILTMRPKVMSDHLRNKGWTRGVRRHSWRASPTENELLVLHPDSARGLEFDGVVVVEPAEFPARLGRHGVLYTSLTRATKELAVVHAKPLPKGMKAR